MEQTFFGFSRTNVLRMTCIVLQSKIKFSIRFRRIKGLLKGNCFKFHLKNIPRYQFQLHKRYRRLAWEDLLEKNYWKNFSKFICLSWGNLSTIYYNCSMLTKLVNHSINLALFVVSLFPSFSFISLSLSESNFRNIYCPEENNWTQDRSHHSHLVKVVC